MNGVAQQLAAAQLAAAARAALGPARRCGGASSLSRFVVVGRVGETDVSEDLFVVEEDPPVRRVMKRIHGRVAGDARWRRALSDAVPALVATPPGVATLVDAGVDDEERLCLVLEAPRVLPRWLAAPRSAPEAAHLALAAAAVAAAFDGVHRRPLTREGVDVAAAALGAGDAEPAARVLVRDAGIPAWPSPPPRGGARAAEGAAQEVLALVDAWGFAAAHAGLEGRPAFDALRRIAAPALPARTGALAPADARRFLGALRDPDVDELLRVQAALAVSRAPGCEGRAGEGAVAAALVASLNEPLAWLPRVALELLSSWPSPFGLRVDGHGLLRMCPHPIARADVVTELGGAAVLRWCPDCDSEVVLPQCVSALASRSDAAAALTGVDERDEVAVVDGHRRFPLWRGQSLSLGGALALVNAGGGRVVLRRLTLPGDVELQLFRPGQRVHAGGDT